MEQNTFIFGRIITTILYFFTLINQAVLATNICDNKGVPLP